ncbi:hypothetical protein QYM36_005465 [Artemia franciscana]|uniref:Protein Wnt n=1 Tax=Artemia franciscana TaxID=6661 RepID=A0AA88HYD7_ARTSF|nr:hypothetical protein QYM36_005465 [Artemia franciscana]
MLNYTRFLSKLQLSSAMSTRPYCNHFLGLEKRQKIFCQKHPDIMVSVAYGALVGVRECQNQFKTERWNCSSPEKDTSVFGKSLQKIGSREAAFVYAISSAGVVHAITRACSKGELSNCACDPRKKGISSDKKGEFAWGGCSDNIKFGMVFSRRFIDAKEKRLRDARALMNLHNNRAGRRAVQETTKLMCKCHGVSGSCTTRTCWNALPDFRKVGSILKIKYDTAREVSVSGSASSSSLVSIDKSRPLSRSELVYFEASPDYCGPNQSYGSLGTGGRVCQKDSDGPDSCESLCCGRGYDTHRVFVTEKCRCKFQWCCTVECETCSLWKEEHRCKPDRSDYRPRRSTQESNGDADLSDLKWINEEENADAKEWLMKRLFRPKKKNTQLTPDELFRLQHNVPFVRTLENGVTSSSRR